jgi:alpha-1,3-rhamnosyl/mannosyltransferase
MVYKAFPETVRTRTKYMLDTGLKRSLKRADAIVTDSEFSKREILKYFPEHENKLHVVPCGVNLTRFNPNCTITQVNQVKEKYNINSDYFLYIGTIEPRKNLERLMKAYKIFCDSNNNKDTPKLVLAGGKGWLDSTIYSTVEELKITDKVIFTQYIASEDMTPLLCGALCFVFPSLYEGFGMPPLEAMACGTPVLTSNSASLPEVVGDCALICDPYSEKDIASKLSELYNNATLRTHLSKSGIDRAKMFTWEKSAELLYDIYKEVLT